MACVRLTGQVASVVVRGDEKLLLLDPTFFVVDVAEELVQRVGLVEARAPMGRQSPYALVPLIDRSDLFPGR